LLYELAEEKESKKIAGRKMRREAWLADGKL